MTGMTLTHRDDPLAKFLRVLLRVVPHDMFTPQQLLHATLPITADAVFKFVSRT